MCVFWRQHICMSQMASYNLSAGHTFHPLRRDLNALFCKECALSVRQHECGTFLVSILSCCKNIGLADKLTCGILQKQMHIIVTCCEFVTSGIPLGSWLVCSHYLIWLLPSLGEDSVVLHYLEICDAPSYLLALFLAPLSALVQILTKL